MTQSASEALNPAHTIGELLLRPLRLFASVCSAAERDRTVAELLSKVQDLATLTPGRPVVS